MCKQENYSKYQKHAIKFLSEHLGTETPFTYERTQTNHLKVLIEGVEKPMFTSSTPSDSKTLKNFMADVKRELKAGKAEHPPHGALSPQAAMMKTITPSYEKLTQNCIKALRSRLNIIKPQEQEQVLKSQSLEVVPSYRHDIIKHAIARAIQERKQGAYIKPQEMKKIEKKLTQHLNFMMPTLADYSALLENKTRYQKMAPSLNELKTALNGASDLQIEDSSVAHSRIAVNQAVNKVLAHNGPTNPIAATASLRDVERKTTSIKPSRVQFNGVEAEQVADYLVSNASSSANSAVELMSMSANNRVSLLRDLSKAQALQLIDDINQAMALNLDQDIAAVVAMIKEKNIPLEAIISRVEMA